MLYEVITGYAFTQNRTDYVWGEATSTAKNYAGQPVGRIYNYDGENWRFANTFTYSKKDILPNQDLTVLLGQEMSSRITSYNVCYTKLLRQLHPSCLVSPK